MFKGYGLWIMGYGLWVKKNVSGLGEDREAGDIDSEGGGMLISS